MKMKKKVLLAIALAFAAVPLFAANVNGFENFVLSRSDFKSNPSSPLANFSSRTWTEDGTALATFSSRKPCGSILTVR